MSLHTYKKEFLFRNINKASLLKSACAYISEIYVINNIVLSKYSLQVNRRHYCTELSLADDEAG